VNRAVFAQNNVRINLNFLDDDEENGVANLEDICPDTPAGEIVEEKWMYRYYEPLASIDSTSTAGHIKLSRMGFQYEITVGYHLSGGTMKNSSGFRLPDLSHI